MINTIRRLDDAMASIEKSAVLLCFSILVLFIVITILSRNVWHLPSHQLFEAGPRLVLWLALLGASLALKRQRHIRLELALRHCSPRVRTGAGVVSGLFGALVMGVLFAASLAFVQNEIAMFGAWGRLSVIFPIFFGMAAFRYLAGILYRLAPEPTRQARPIR
ncbi:hypothetical protein DSCA_07460 [Desulfosarcina alkanivorans]|jgi:TRAP-type C4-dicarboxylate transport system permease small subunit|uniref:Tripartite ATP-independent periplasmic transporters DctQ component domain-containing protein n=1 Tax=Desulfosarcina alkanivorans TaxID=571177 RepID=A0A5K7YCZ0_9BACT|nr:TRAP transporter small permease subunit [Desulfosarcina alkanivorans]BBO66816.1 hypothetical protein DSCA_07460 [Desulfosarcina alkanivorans]